MCTSVVVEHVATELDAINFLKTPRRKHVVRTEWEASKEPTKTPCLCLVSVLSQNGCVLVSLSLRSTFEISHVDFSAPFSSEPRGGNGNWKKSCGQTTYVCRYWCTYFSQIFFVRVSLSVTFEIGFRSSFEAP